MIAGDAAAGEIAHAPHALVREGAVAHEVAGAQVGLDVLVGQEGQRSVEGVEVGVHVGDDREAHQPGAGGAAGTGYRVPAVARHS